MSNSLNPDWKGKARIFILVDLRDFFFFRFRGGGGVEEKKSSENDQLTGHFQSFYFFQSLFFLISPEKNSKPTVCIKSLTIL